MRDKGLPTDSVLKELGLKVRNDFSYRSGRVVGSMCTSPHPFGSRTYCDSLEANLGDPGLFPGVSKLEEDAVQMMGALLSNPTAPGHIVTGGTEANILALWAAKRLSGNKGLCRIITPMSAHCSFEKAAALLSLETVKIRPTSSFQIDVKAVEKAIDKRTIAIVGVAGTTDLGVVDPIHELSEIAVERDVYLHVDAAFGGFVLPFLKELGYSSPDFDFSLPGVSSITIDPHKMGLAPIPAGGILFRDEELRKSIAWDVSYLAGGRTEQATLVGTRSGASVIAVWSMLRHLGKDGYRRVVKRCMHLTLELADKIRRLEGIDLVCEPTMNILGVESKEFDIRLVAKELRAKRWAVSRFPNHMRLVVMPHTREEQIAEFAGDLENTVETLRG